MRRHGIHRRGRLPARIDASHNRTATRLRDSQERPLGADSPIEDLRGQFAARDTLIVREVMDGLCAQLVAYRRTAAQSRGLQFFVEAMTEAAWAGNPELVAIAHGRFDELMYEACGNAALQRLGHQTRPLVRAFIQARVNGTGQLQRLADETNCILQAVARRAPGEAADASRELIVRTRTQLEQLELAAERTRTRHGLGT